MQDSGDVFSNTLKPDLAAGINRVEKGQAKFQKTANHGKRTCSLVDLPPEPAATPVAEAGVQDITAYMVGDLKFLSMMLEIGNFDGYWCYICRLPIGGGGDLTGGCVKKLTLFALLLDERTDECSLEVDEIKDLCTEQGLLLTNWDGALQKLHTKNSTDIYCSKTQEFIDRALSLTRKLGISVTAKGHGGESHFVAQMHSTPEGLFEFDESWTEQYHQTGYG
ncbi:hypothetical protein ACHAWF_008325, partial [Thalassiosira exigua]